jgi:hypothetical protein
MQIDLNPCVYKDVFLKVIKTRFGVIGKFDGFGSRNGFLDIKPKLSPRW